MAGTTWDVVVLSSSPPAPSPFALNSTQNGPPPRRVAVPGSSPLMFSPRASPKRRIMGASKVNLRAAAIPEGAVRGFATMGNLVQSDYFARQSDDDVVGTKQLQSPEDTFDGTRDTTEPVKKPEKPKKPSSAKRSTNDGSEKSKPKPRRRKSKVEIDALAHDPELRLPPSSKSPFFEYDAAQIPIKLNNEPQKVDPKLTKTGKPRKPHTKKQKQEEEETVVQSKMKKPRTIKSKAVPRDEKLHTEGLLVLSPHFHSPAGELARDEGTTSHKNLSKESVPESPSKGVALEEAVARRRDWTPPAEDTAIRTPSTKSIGKENVFGAGDDRAFTHLVSNFALAQSIPMQTNATAVESSTKVVGTTKRRRVELVEIPGKQTISRATSPVKGKAPKKKARTITDLVIDQFAPKESNHPLSVPIVPPNTTIIPLNDACIEDIDTTLKKPPRKRANTKADSDKLGTKSKLKRGVAKSTKPQSMIGKLLSPSSALSRLDRQDFLFGTSSQLALEESPVTARQLQLAIRASEQDTDTLPGLLPTPPLRWPKLGKVEGSKGHWAASARDEGGGIFEHMEDVYTPETNRIQGIRSAADGRHDESNGQNIDIDVDELDPPSIVLISSDLPTPRHVTSRASQTSKSDNDDRQPMSMVFKDIDDFEQEPPPSNQNVKLQNDFMDIDELEFTPSAEGKTSTRMMTSDGALKKGPRKHAKSHLTKLIASTSPTSATQSLASCSKEKGELKASLSLVALSTPPKPVSRFIDIEEILDSEDERLEALSPTPPRIRNKGTSLSLQLVSLDPIRPKVATQPTSGITNNPALTPIFRIPVQHLQWEHIKKQVFDRITAHIRSLPPTTNLKAPSWHERILMYEPIVLEDFTTYLNTQTDIRTYKRATQKQIKAWNKMLKRDGQATLRVDESGEEILAVEKILEPYMAQNWCESLSICCIWGEGKGKGVARKGLY